MPSKSTTILDLNQYQKSDEIPFEIDPDLESLIKKICGFKSNTQNSSTTKVGEHIPCGYSMSTIWLFDIVVNMHNLCRGDNCIKRFSKSLREHPMKKMIPLTNKDCQSCFNPTNCHICKKKVWRYLY